MVEISLVTEVTMEECAAVLRYIKPDGTVHERRYSCVRLAADSAHRAELKALAVGIKKIRYSARVVVYLKDINSTAAINQEWPQTWMKNGWKNKKGRLVRDWELWKEIYTTINAKQIIIAGGSQNAGMGTSNQKIP